MLSVPIFNKESGIFYARDEHSFRLLGWNLLGVTVIMAWSITLAFILFITLRITKQLRVSEEIELKGEFRDSYGLIIECLEPGKLMIEQEIEGIFFTATLLALPQEGSPGCALLRY